MRSACQRANRCLQDSTQATLPKLTTDMTLKTLKQTVTGLLPSMRSGRWGLFCDIDGTISDIAPRPEQARVRPGAKRALEALGERLDAVAVVTGRDMKEALCMVEAENIVYFATHGLERWENGEMKVAPEAEPHRDRLRNATAELTARLTFPGIVIQTKQVGLSIHYRIADDPESTRAAILEAVESTGAGDWMLVRDGRMVVELLLPVAIDKGTSLRTLAEERNLNGALVLGDDVTDVNMFRAAAELQAGGGVKAVNIGVVGDETPAEVMEATEYWLAGVDEVEAFLIWLSSELGASRSAS